MADRLPDSTLENATIQALLTSVAEPDTPEERDAAWNEIVFRDTALREARHIFAAMSAEPTEDTLAEAVVARWEALGHCEDEFGCDSEFCGEYAESLDAAIHDLRAALLASRGVSAENEETNR